MGPSDLNGQEQDLERHCLASKLTHLMDSTSNHVQANISPFIGRLGASGRGGISRDASNKDVLKEQPDAAPLMSVAEQFSLWPFLTAALWKAALMEGIDTADAKYDNTRNLEWKPP